MRTYFPLWLFIILVVLALIAISPRARAAEAPKPPENPCGKTVEECQKAYDAQLKLNKTYSLEYNYATQQRDSLAKQLNDTILNGLVAQSK